MIKNIDIKNYNFLSFETKVTILKVIIEGCYQLDILKKHISQKIEDI